MNKDIAQAQEDNSLTLNYNKWVFELIAPYLKDRVLDAGCGAGNFIRYMLDKKVIVACDVESFFLEAVKKNYGSFSHVHAYKCDIQDKGIIGICAGYSVDSVICNNVLEHVPDDIKALENACSILPAGGVMALIVPAVPCLYNKWDAAVGHMRRYSKAEVIDKLSRSGFRVKKAFYINMLGMAAWFINGAVLGNTPASSLSIQRQAVFFDRYMVRPIRALESAVGVPIGQSIIAIAYKD